MNAKNQLAAEVFEFLDVAFGCLHRLHVLTIASESLVQLAILKVMLIPFPVQVLKVNEP